MTKLPSSWEFGVQRLHNIEVFLCVSQPTTDFRVTEAAGDLWGSTSPSSCSKPAQLQQIAEGHN